jgi:hypothetical protein
MEDPLTQPNLIPAESVPALLDFLRGLADARRLQIVGRLAGGRYSVEQLAEMLSEKPATIQRQLDQLIQLNLVDGPESKAQTYRLRLDRIHALAGQVLAHPRTPVPAGAAADDYEHTVLREFLLPDGGIREFPAQEKKFQVVVRYALRAFEAGQRYTEKEVNERLKRLNRDSATLRRAMIDYGLMQREAGGRAYWRAGN